MVKRLMLVTALTALVLSACSALGQEAPTATPAPVNTDTPAPTVTQAIIATEPQATATIDPALPTATVTTAASPTVDPARPTNDPACTNKATFVADVTIPDNTEVEGGSTFVKTWRISNTGTCIWGPDYTLTHYSDERMGAPASIPLGITYPGQTLDISMSLTAPNGVGSHRANFVIKNPAGLIMKVNDDSRLWLIIQVKNAGAPTAAPTVAAVVPTNTQAAAVVPTNTSANTNTTSGAGLVNATCSFSIDQSKMLQVINAVNTHRSQNGLPNYNVNQQLVKAAQAHANDMACNNLNSHTGSNSSTIESRVAASGYTAAVSGENVYVSNPPATGQDAVNSWINNTDTKIKLNLVSDSFIDIGVGYASFNNSGYYVIVFGTP